MQTKTLTTLQKTGRILWAITWSIYLISLLFESAHNLFQPIKSLLFIEGVRQLIITVFYAIAGFILLGLIWSRDKIIINIVSEEGLKKIKALWYTIFGLGLFKFLYTYTVILFILPSIADQSKANLFGYTILTGLKPYSDLFIAVAILGVLFSLLNHTVKLKKENDLTI